MTDERLCAAGHVIDPGRETCSRCNGLPVNVEAPEVVAEAAPKKRVTKKRAPAKRKVTKKVR